MNMCWKRRKCFLGELPFRNYREISSIYKKNGKCRKVHNVLLLSGLEEADKIAGRLEKIGNIHSDGRPILGLDCHDLLEILLENCADGMLVPAHIWTPHFGFLVPHQGLIPWKNVLKILLHMFMLWKRDYLQIHL